MTLFAWNNEVAMLVLSHLQSLEVKE